MLFTKSFTVKTTHTEAAPLVDTIPIAHGIISFVSIHMPSGCHGLVYCKLKHHEHSVFPSQEDMYLTADTNPVEWTEYYESYQPPYELKFIGWAYETRYDHVITVRVAVLPRKAIVSLAIVDTLKGVLGMLSPVRLLSGRQGKVIKDG